MLLKLALQMARDDYEDRRERQRQGIELAKAPAGMPAARPAGHPQKPVAFRGLW
jgi:DNA invertase Pin-like site-specific DNA recombinase